ncbi:MAG: lipoyl(octanoyl) transferase LipB [Pseudomonadota bacterium]|nr:lipoyl(octanoyl) transferase LipB [Pseudomonadota bacterium]|tara:strand:+ start:684 stop:1307 length:624 start_codon:yes stop_codon:yes gene_type:complete
MIQNLKVKKLGLQDYKKTWASMMNTVLSKSEDDQDEVWLLEHPPVFTLGLGGEDQHILSPGNIPVVKSDRGGQATYHGPGQLVVYFMLNLKRLGWGPKRLINELEELIINLFKEYGIKSSRMPGAPGVYIDGEKIASIGLKIKRGFSYHGISLNIDMDLDPFLRINTCGFESLKVTQLSNFRKITFQEVQTRFEALLLKASQASIAP